ncbi:late competence development ComFB family protein [Hominiventricola aquisgranensis]|uniref:Late competence development ComFB family protein n=1 Tax=Hominiventricola aquisgranensis TaxID=3133164 RepID=A0ABV1I2D9_9FIRM
MARKSNKTAHVLNLLSGHDTKKEPEKELETDVKKDADPISEQDSQPKDAQQPHPDPEPTEKIPQGKISVPDSPSVSIIDQTEKDPVAEQIQANLFQEFQKEHDMNPEESQKESREKEPEAEPVAEPESTIVSEPEPEPEFVRINVMERIVSDKIIYFMRQFECCTCEKCIADTIALTLNGLPPKYIVTEPAAEAPLLSFYTNHFISEITVEATKACMTVKETPRHKNGAS